MGSKERITRIKEHTRSAILHAAMTIVREEGWNGLSMRKIADIIEYTPPIIYGYFANKEAILLELTNQGYRELSLCMRQAKSDFAEPVRQLEAMWLAYWEFAFSQKEIYQLMFGIGTGCCHQKAPWAESEYPGQLIMEVIKALLPGRFPSKELVYRKYYSFWSFVHGLISINMVNKGTPEKMSLSILRDAIGAISASIEENI